MPRPARPSLNPMVEAATPRRVGGVEHREHLVEVDGGAGLAHRDGGAVGERALRMTQSDRQVLLPDRALQPDRERRVDGQPPDAPVELEREQRDRLAVRRPGGLDAVDEPDQRAAHVHLGAVGQLVGVGDLHVQRVAGHERQPVVGVVGQEHRDDHREHGQRADQDRASRAGCDRGAGSSRRVRSGSRGGRSASPMSARATVDPASGGPQERLAALGQARDRVATLAAEALAALGEVRRAARDRAGARTRCSRSPAARRARSARGCRSRWRRWCRRTAAPSAARSRPILSRLAVRRSSRLAAGAAWVPRLVQLAGERERGDQRGLRLLPPRCRGRSARFAPPWRTGSAR